ncbi:hypothetical protein [Actinospongicola halichondriae]|uniref:hypothetical protein n=1 Tax=Actinospongicola halichondriae TaxID=3236844 RepID=UPI003D5A5A8E
MGKASSNKKVARAAKAGGGRARAAGERNFLFPAALSLVMVLGLVLVVYARDTRSAEALEAPLANEDHWHSAYGVFICDQMEPQLPEFIAPQNGGNHTHGDGLLHIHPFATSRSGKNATLVNWFADAGVALGGGGVLEDDRLELPAGKTYEEGTDTCEGLDGDPIVQVAVWESAQAGLDGADPVIVTENFDEIRFDADGQAFTIAFAPEGTEIPLPDSTGELSSVGADLGVPEDQVPDDAQFDGATDDTTVDDTTTDDTTPDDTTTDDTTTDDTTVDATEGDAGS